MQITCRHCGGSNHSRITSLQCRMNPRHPNFGQEGEIAAPLERMVIYIFIQKQINEVRCPHCGLIGHTRSNHHMCLLNPRRRTTETALILNGVPSPHHLGNMKICQYCNAQLYHNEPHGFCCNEGKVVLEELLPLPQELRALFYNADFQKNIRAYNQAFAFTSMGAKIDEELAQTAGVYSFRIHGQVSHRIGIHPTDI